MNSDKFKINVYQGTSSGSKQIIIVQVEEGKLTPEYIKEAVENYKSNDYSEFK